MFVTFVAVIGFIVLLDVGIATGRGTDWWASAGQWVGGVGSIGAAGVAVWIAVEGWRRSEHQAAEQQTRDQASKFAVWIGKMETEKEISPQMLAEIGVMGAMILGDQRTLKLDEYVLMFQNSSPLPIYQVAVSVRVLRDRSFNVRSQVCPPGPLPQVLDGDDSQTFHARLTSLVQDATPNDDSSLARVREAELRHLKRLYRDPHDVITRRSEITVTFRDANGLRWVRQPDGQLVRR
ncbi:hypothetical protein [Amycolatopsis sp. VC5-11]|uniref:hypothetical protein n=1 Tax=Amycolatopsis sp. VC5-11 TaxID=3120156 RepID=UPI003008160C